MSLIQESSNVSPSRKKVLNIELGPESFESSTWYDLGIYRVEEIQRKLSKGIFIKLLLL